VKHICSQQYFFEYNKIFTAGEVKQLVEHASCYTRCCHWPAKIFTAKLAALTTEETVFIRS